MRAFQLPVPSSLCILRYEQLVKTQVSRTAERNEFRPGTVAMNEEIYVDYPEGMKRPKNVENLCLLLYSTVYEGIHRIILFGGELKAGGEGHESSEHTNS